uniref:Uncharacterized protein n=1 Tax=Tanacetum cinerariifolium TaxID=118510 RepID=A0A6L2K6V9_TANCI|nr:hypothetical protein [Tanacetum cinerariifolium]
MDQRMNEAVKIIKEQVKEQFKAQVFKILPKIEKTVNEQLEAEVLTRSSNSSKTSYVVAADLSEMELKKILIEKMESNKSIHRSDEQRNLYKSLEEAYESDKIILDIYGDTVILKRRRNDEDKDEEPSSGSDWGSKRQREGKEPDESALAEEPMKTNKDLEEPLHQEFETGVADDQPIVEASQQPEWFQQQKKPPTPDRAWNKTLPATHESIQPWICDLAKQADSHSSFNELMDTLVDFSSFLMNRLKVDTLTPELLAGPTYELVRGTSSRKYTTFITKTKETDYGHIKWIEDLVPRTMWSQEPMVKWHHYKHLDWITMHKDDEKLYKFKEGDFKRLRIQDIKDMLLLLVQGKLTNLTVEERFAFNISLRMFTRSIVIQRRVEDLQLGVESYQKKLNLTKAGYNKDKQMRIDELHKFSDGTLNDVRTALDDRLKGIRMKYMPQAIMIRKEQQQ